jgi:hypothetical protein
MDIQNLLASVNWTTPTWDLFILIFFLAAVFLYGFSLGRDRIIIILISIYISLTLIYYFPFFEAVNSAELKFGEAYIFQIGLFLFAVLAIFFLISRSAVYSIFGGGSQGSWWQVLLFSFLQVGLFLSIVLSFLPEEIISELAPLTKQVFIGRDVQFVWLLAPVLAMVLVGKRKKSEE